MQVIIGPLQFTIIWYKNRHAGTQTAHWDIQNKRILSWVSLLLVVDYFIIGVEKNGSQNILKGLNFVLWSWVFLAHNQRASNGSFSHDVTAAMLVYQNKGTAAILVYKDNPLGIELYFYANTFFCFIKPIWPLVTWVKTLYIAKFFRENVLENAVFLQQLQLQQKALFAWI